MITRAELLARLHATAPAPDRPVIIDLSAYAEQYGERLADMAHRILSLIHFSAEPRRVLELHPGPVALAAALDGPAVWAIEPSQSNRRRLEEAGVNVVSGSWPAAQPEGRFDLIVAAGVLSGFSEHELKGELAENLHGLLAPGGQLLVLEQGNRPGGRAVIALRGGLMRVGVRPILPCPHLKACPMSEQRRRVCALTVGDEEPPEGVDPVDRNVSMLLAGRDAMPRHAEPYVIGRAKRIDERVELPVCHGELDRIVASVADHTRRGGGLYQMRPGCYVDLPADRSDGKGGLLPGPPLVAARCLFDDDAL